MRFKLRPGPRAAPTTLAAPAERVLRPQQIVVPVSGQLADRDAMRIACRLARPERATIHALRVVEVGRNLPLSALLEEDLVRAEADLAAVEPVARAAGVPFETGVLQAREAGPALVDEAQGRGADLFVIVVRHRRRQGEVQLGRTAAYILANAECPVLLLRDWKPEPSGRGRIETAPAID
ncbi:MAG TPA: universal stress protein [Verrucomicrobiae bacterium]|nr:universal stress protein [Verrucomicrobiae bacterium]